MVTNLEDFNPFKRKSTCKGLRTAQLIANRKFLPERSRKVGFQNVCDKLSYVKNIFLFNIFYILKPNGLNYFNLN